MNISLQNVDNVSAVLTVQIEKADYQEKVEKALKTLRQRVNMPGFRKGMVPMGLIKKQYGTSVLLEEVDEHPLILIAVAIIKVYNMLRFIIFSS